MPLKKKNDTLIQQSANNNIQQKLMYSDILKIQQMKKK